MSWLAALKGLLFPGGKNVIVETAGAFRVNAEAADQRAHSTQGAAMAQFGQEFMIERKGWFDRFVDGLNRLPRPGLALGVLFLIGSSMYSPIWFAARMEGLALVPDQLWWLLGTIVAFYFGGRYQAKSQQFHEGMANSAENVMRVLDNVRNIEALDDTEDDPPPESDNPVIDSWRQ